MAIVELINKEEISDVMIERPISFTVKHNRYAIYPPTLGKIQLTFRLIESLCLENYLSAENDIHFSILTLVCSRRNDCIRLVAYSTLPGAECLDETAVRARISELDQIDDEDIASIIMLILSQDKTEVIKKQFFMDKDAENMGKVMRVKQKDKGTISFGGRSIWGALIDNACERYGWSYQYVLWGISYSNLQLLLADQIRTVYLTDKERKQIHISTDGQIIRAEDRGSMEQFIKKQSWK